MMASSHQGDGSDGEAEASMIDPSSLYTLDDYLVQKDMLDSFAKEIATEVKESLEEQAKSSRSGPRTYVNRPREAAAEQLDPTSSFFVNIRPGWDDLKNYLITTSGRQTYKVYVCTMAGIDYALEAWRLLDPNGNLISSEEISQHLICVKPDSKKSLERVFQESLCHPNMALVIDDRRDAWDDKDKQRVQKLPIYNPSASREDKVLDGHSVLQIVRNVTWNARQEFFRDFDGMLLKTVNELMYENDVLDLPYTPDVCDYLQPRNYKIVRHSDASIYPKDISGAEVDSGSKN